MKKNIYFLKCVWKERAESRGVQELMQLTSVYIMEEQLFRQTFVEKG